MNNTYYNVNPFIIFTLFISFRICQINLINMQDIYILANILIVHFCKNKEKIRIQSHVFQLNSHCFKNLNPLTALLRLAKN